MPVGVGVSVPVGVGVDVGPGVLVGVGVRVPVGVGVNVPVGVGVDVGSGVLVGVGVGVLVGVGVKVPVGVGVRVPVGVGVDVGVGVAVGPTATKNVFLQASFDGGISGIVQESPHASGLDCGADGAIGCVPNCLIFKAVITTKTAKIIVTKITPIKIKFFFFISRFR